MGLLKGSFKGSFRGSCTSIMREPLQALTYGVLLGLIGFMVKGTTWFY